MSLEKLIELEKVATRGPWFVVYTDDRDHMCASYVGTVDRGDRHDNETGMDGSRVEEVVAVTLLQSPPMACHDSERWDENAELIAAMRNELPSLLEELVRLRRTCKPALQVGEQP